MPGPITELLFVSCKLGHSKNTQYYSKVDSTDMELIGVKAHDVRAFAASKAFYGGTSMDQIMQAFHWKSHNAFTKFYLKDLTGQDQKEGSYYMGSFVAAQHIMPPSHLAPGKKTGGPLLPVPFRRGVSESSDTI